MAEKATNYCGKAAELQSALQTKDEQMLKLTQTMSSMQKKMESVQNQIVGMEMQTPLWRSLIVLI